MPTGTKKHPYSIGVPFKPIRAVPVDMFPHTPHCELAVLFERAREARVSAPTHAVDATAAAAAGEAPE